MSLERVRRGVEAGEIQPVYVLVGSERLLVDRAVSLLRSAVLAEDGLGLNEDVFAGASLETSRLLDAVRTLPMMAPRRFVLVRDLHLVPASEHERLLSYLARPSPTTCFVLTGAELDGRTRLARALKEGGWWFDLSPPKGQDLLRFIVAEARARGHAISSSTAEALVSLLGPDVDLLDDALERLSLYVGAKASIDSAAIEACVHRTRPDSVWALVDAVALGDRRRALAAASSLLSDGEPPLRMLALVARQVRLVAKTRGALRAGLAPAEAVRSAGAPPFKVRELIQAARRFDGNRLRRAFESLAEADQALKSSKRPPRAIFEKALLHLCSA